jgi:hypothetical protein
MQGLGRESHSRAVGRAVADAGTLFRDASIQYGTNTGGDDYRLVAGSPAINAGSNAHCGHTPVGACDIGPYEFDASSLTGPAVRPFGELITFSALSSSGPPPAPLAKAPKRERRPEAEPMPRSASKPQ